MIEKTTPDGTRYWQPSDASDAALLSAADGATFGGTTFPSGWRSPDGKQVARGGLLYEEKSPPTGQGEGAGRWGRSAG